MSDAKSVMQSVAKTFAVLSAFTINHPELTILEVGERAALDRGTASRLIDTLVALGNLAAVSGTRRLRPTSNASISATPPSPSAACA